MAQEWAERRLRKFVELTWPALEPDRAFVGGWAIDALCEHLEAVSAGEIRRLLINVPPGFMKSLSTNVFWPAWEWGPRDQPGLRYVSASYSEALTIRDNRRCRNLILSREYQRHWGHRFQLSGDQNAKVRFENSRTGFKLATSVGGVSTGERGDRFIVDDPHNVKEGESELKRESALQWFAEVVPTRLNDPEKSAIVVIMQRVHERDVSGLILSKELGYDHLCLPMEFEAGHPYRKVTRLNFHDPRREEGELLWPERYPRYYLENELKPALSAWGGSYAVAGQLQQRPSPRGGGMFRAKDFRIVNELPDDIVVRVRGWDLASTEDLGAPLTAGVLLCKSREGTIYIADCCAGNWGPLEVETRLQSTARADGRGVRISVPQDPGQAGKAQKAHLAQKLLGFNVHFSPESGSKEDRARPFAAQVEAGNVCMVRGDWNEEYLEEAKHFPRGATKDRIDATSRAFTELTKPRRGIVAGAPQALRVG